jgi:hypothetical protein
MKTTLLIALATGLAQLAPMPAVAAERPGVNKHTGLYELPLSDLRKAAERSDRAELGRTAERIGPGRMTKALADTDRRVVLAALEALPLFDAGVLLLGNTVPLLASGDAGVRAQAARTVGLLLTENDAGKLAEWEIAQESLQAVCRGLGRIATDDKEETNTRVLAIQALLDAGETCAPSATLAGLQAASAPEVRRAAVLALPSDAASAKTLAHAAADRDSRVAAAAGAQWCRLQLRQRPKAGTQIGTPTGGLAPLTPPLRTLVRSERALPEDVIDMLPCLKVSSEAEDKQALDDLRARGATAVREALKQTDANAKAPKP